MDREDYELTGAPIPYPEPRELSQEERDLFAHIDRDYWKEFAPDRLGRRGRHPSQKLTHREVELVSVAIVECRLLTQIGSGMFGLSGYSMSISEIPPIQGMVEDGPKRLTTLMSDHMPWYREGSGPASRYQRDWIFFTRFTHSPENLAMLDHLKMKRPEERSHYDY